LAPTGRSDVLINQDRIAVGVHHHETGRVTVVTAYRPVTRTTLPAYPAALEQSSVSPSGLGQREPRRHHRLDPARRQQVEEFSSALRGTKVVGPSRDPGQRRLLAVRDECSRARINTVAGMMRSPLFLVAATPNHTSRPPLRRTRYGTPELACAADGVEHDIHPVAGQITDALDEVLVR